MTIYQVPAKSPNQRYVRILAFIGITVMLGLWLISAYNPPSFTDSTNRFLGLFGLLVVLVAGSCAALLNAREGLWKVKRGLRIEVSDEKLIETHDGATSTEIPFGSIKEIVEYSGGLVISGTEAASGRISVPKEVVGFEELKQHLTSFSNIQPAKTKGFARLVLHLAALISALSLLFLSHHRILILSDGIALF